MVKKLTQNLQQYFASSGCTKAIIGVSGGVDSAVTLAIAAKAIEPKNITPVLMPYKLGNISSHKNFSDAQEICKKLLTIPRIIPIDEFITPYQSHLPEIKDVMVSANTLARIRMTLLFALANAENGLVLGTCNKTEVMLGYETKFGDGAADVSVLGKLWKTEVWKLAKELELPEKFITKTPSAELYIGHTDEEELGFSYQEADTILQALENGEQLEKNENTKKIQTLIQKSEHKRHMAPVLDIS